MTEFFKTPLAFFQSIADCINKNDKLALLVMFVCTVCYKLYFITDGISVLDSAFYLSYSIDLDSAMEYSSFKTSPFYLTALISNLFLKMFSAKLLGLRILQILNYLFLFFCVFRLLRNKIPNICIVGGTLMSLMVLCSRPIEFYYDDLSASLCVLSILLMVKAIEKANKVYIFFSGFVFALNIFARVPNVVYIVLASYVFLFCKDKRVSIPKLLVVGVSGFFTGTLSFLLIIYIKGDLMSLYDGFVGIARLSQDADDSHNLFSMLTEAAEQIKSILVIMLKNVAVLVLVKYAYKLKFKWIAYLMILAFIVKSVHTFIVMPLTIRTYFLAWTSFALLFVIKFCKPNRFLALLLLVALYIMPFGSDYYFRVSISYIYSAAIAPFILYSLILVKRNNFACKLTFHLYTASLCLAIVCNCFSSNNNAFTEYTSRSERRFEVENCPMLKYAYTDSAKAAKFIYYIQEVKPLLNKKTILIGCKWDLMLAVSMEKVLYNNSPKNWGTNKTVYNAIISTYEKTKEKPDVLLRKSDMQDKDCPEIRFMKEVGGYSKKWENEKYTLFSPEN